MDFSKLIEAINGRLTSIPLDLRLYREGRSGTAREAPSPGVQPAAPPRQETGADGSRLSSRASVSARRGPWSKFQAVVQSMTNHQRHQWARAGYPGLRQKDVKALRRFVR